MSGIHIVRDVEVPLADGTRTAAEVWLPDVGGPHPAVLVRSPYIKELEAPAPVIDTRLATHRGYAVVLQDVRGRGASGGRWEPFVHEERDGFDSVQWVAAQPWCDGRVTMAGMSYVGATQWLAAAAAPPGLAAIAPTLSSDDYGEGWSYSDGVPEHGFLTSWGVVELAPPERRLLDDPAVAWNDMTAAIEAAPWLSEWLAAGPGSDYWRARSVAHRRADVRVPALVVAGWYDIFLRASLSSFARSRDHRDRLVIGPWGHDGQLSHLVGDANVGIAGLGLPFFGWLLDFFDSVLDGRDPDCARVRAYALGARRWVDLPSWPPPRTETISHALEPGSFEVDPRDPVPSRGGRGLLLQVPGSGFGIVDQRSVAERDDVHVAARITVADDTLIAGPVTARLTTRAGGDEPGLWTATLCYEAPGGALHNLVEGVAAARGDASSVEIALGDTFTLLPARSILVLLVAGSAFPRWPLPRCNGRQEILDGSALELTVAAPSLLG